MENVTVNLIPLYACAKLRARAQSSWHAWETIGVQSGRILWKIEIFLSSIVFTGFKKSNQNQPGKVLPFAFVLTCNKICLNMHIPMFSDVGMPVMGCVDCVLACSKEPFLASLNPFTWWAQSQTRTTKIHLCTIAARESLRLLNPTWLVEGLLLWKPPLRRLLKNKKTKTQRRKPNNTLLFKQSSFNQKEKHELK